MSRSLALHNASSPARSYEHNPARKLTSTRITTCRKHLTSLSHASSRPHKHVKASDRTARPTTPRTLTTTSLQRSPDRPDFNHLTTTLPSRTLPPLHDHLTPTPSHLLATALADFLPDWAVPPSARTPHTLPSVDDAAPLPPAHHLVYFPPATPASALLPDGTDPLQSPGPPFVRRMWAGGSLSLARARPHALRLDGRRAVCRERIADVSIKGPPGAEKAFVGIERRVGPALPSPPADQAPAVAERRNIVFMRARTPSRARAENAAALAKQLPPPGAGLGLKPDWAWRTAPDAKLLFRYSALTYNAHGIHLDPAYCREVEGHERGLLVHGPLSVTFLVGLMEGFLRGEQGGEVLAGLEYRNLRPLYCGEEVRFCGRRVRGVAEGDGRGRWDVWGETPEGGVAVKGVVWTEVGS